MNCAGIVDGDIEEAMLIQFNANKEKMAFQKCSSLVFEKGLRHSIPVFLSIHASLRESSAAASAWVLCVCPSASPTDAK